MNRKTGKEYFSNKYYLNSDEELILTAMDLCARNQTDLTDINRVLELYNIKLFFETKGNLFGWDNKTYELYKKSTENAVYVVKQFYDTITDDNVVPIYDSCEVELWDSFWEFFYKFRVYERIPKVRFDEIITGLRMPPEKLLEKKEFVNFFDEEIAAKLKQPDYGASFFVSHYLRDNSNNQSCYMPKSLLPTDIYETVSAYIDGDVVNANKLSIIAQGRSRNGKEFNLDDKLRYKAKKRLEKYWKDNANSMIKQDYGVEVSFTPEEEFMHVENRGTYIEAVYGSNWVVENLDYPTLLNNFIYLFGYVDGSMRCTFVAHPNKRGIFEQITTVDGNGMFIGGHSFEILNALANSQMACYMKVLEDNGVYIEDICGWFFENYLKEEFHVEGFKSHFPKHDDNIISKCVLLSSAMEGVLKQYRMYVEDGEINRELYAMSSEQINYKMLPSFCKKKYAYVNDDELKHAMHILFFNENSWMRMIKEDDRYKNLVQFLRGEKNVADYCSKEDEEDKKWLIQNGYLISEDGEIRPNIEKIVLLQQLYDNNCLCIQYFKSAELEQWIADKKVRVSNTLLSEAEAEYIDYLLNKKEFSNGLDLRNKYIHDSVPEKEEQQRRDYTVLMKAMIILIIKINEEFCLRERNEDKRV